MKERRLVEEQMDSRSYGSRDEQTDGRWTDERIDQLMIDDRWTHGRLTNVFQMNM